MHTPPPPIATETTRIMGWMLPLAALLLLGLTIGAAIKGRPHVVARDTATDPPASEQPTPQWPDQDDTSEPDPDDPRPVSGEEVS